MRVFIIGDSTASNKSDNKRPESGWGEHLGDFLNDRVTVCNHAVGGRSTKSFIDEGLFDNVLKEISSGDYLLIQFGHNDGKILDLNRYTEPFFEYQANLLYFINEARKIGATPIVLSSISRRMFIGKHRVKRYAVGNYPKAAYCLAKRENVLFIDCFGQTKKLYQYLGNMDSRYLFNFLGANRSVNYPNGVSDNTHLNLFGANVVAMLIAKAILKLDNPLKNYVIKDKLLDKIKIKDKINATKTKEVF